MGSDGVAGLSVLCQKPACPTDPGQDAWNRCALKTTLRFTTEAQRTQRSQRKIRDQPQMSCSVTSVHHGSAIFSGGIRFRPPSQSPSALCLCGRAKRGLLGWSIRGRAIVGRARCEVRQTGTVPFSQSGKSDSPPNALPRVVRSRELKPFLTCRAVPSRPRQGVADGVAPCWSAGRAAAARPADQHGTTHEKGPTSLRRRSRSVPPRSPPPRCRRR